MQFINHICSPCFCVLWCSEMGRC